MPFPDNAISKHRSNPDSNGDYRTYVVYPVDDKFVFECWEQRDTDSAGSGVGTRKEYREVGSVAEAVALYDEYLEAWEDIKK